MKMPKLLTLNLQLIKREKKGGVGVNCHPQGSHNNSASLPLFRNRSMQYFLLWYCYNVTCFFSHHTYFYSILLLFFAPKAKYKMWLYPRLYLPSCKATLAYVAAFDAQQERMWHLAFFSLSYPTFTMTLPLLGMPNVMFCMYQKNILLCVILLLVLHYHLSCIQTHWTNTNSLPTICERYYDWSFLKGVA